MYLLQISLRNISKDRINMHYILKTICMQTCTKKRWNIQEKCKTCKIKFKLLLNIEFDFDFNFAVIIIKIFMHEKYDV